MNLSELRKQQYQHNEETYPFITDWRKNPYTFIKMRFYMETSPLLVYCFLKLSIKPNTITMFYIIFGIFGGILLAIPSKVPIYLALFIFFILRTTLDNCDGHVARLTNNESFTGGILDDYGAHVNSLGFWTGLGFYLAHASNLMIFFYLVPFLLFFYAADLYMYASFQIIQNAALSKKNILSISNSNVVIGKRPKHLLTRGIIYLYERLANILRDSFPDDRARTYDLVCLLIFLELNSGIFLSWTIFIIYFLKKLILFTYSLYAIVNKKWAENIVNKIWE